MLRRSRLTLAAVAALAATLTAPASAAVIGPGPVFISPVDGQVLDYEGAYIFNLEEVPGAVAYEWVLTQDLAEVHRTTTTAPDLGIFPGDGVHELFSPGSLEVSVRADLGGGDTSEFTTIVLTLRVSQPVFIQPVDGQVLDYEGAYIFNLEPIAEAVAHEWVLTQDLAEVHRTTTTAPDLGIFPGDGVHELFSPGSLEVSVRARRADGSFTSFTTIVLRLRESVLEFVSPQDGDTLDFFATYEFVLDPVPDIVQYRWTFRDEDGVVRQDQTPGPVLSYEAGTPSHGGFTPGPLEVEVEGFRLDFTVTPPASITVTLDPCPGVDEVACFAPQVRFHPAETHFPMDPNDFIANSELVWAADSGCDDPVMSPNPTPETLLRFATFERDGASCTLDLDTLYTAAEFTRPFRDVAGNGARRPDNGQGGRLDENEGFYLDNRLGDDEVGLAPFDGTSAAPVLVENFGPVIRYWFFYGFDPKSPIAGDGPFRHEGDWERIEVTWADGLPLEVQYFAHGCDPIALEPGDDRLEFVENTHPVVYVAAGTHASYPDIVGPFQRACGFATGVTDATRDGGPVWDTWRGASLTSAPDQCWYGFGGAWGETGSGLFKSDGTGPLGPHYGGSGGALPGAADCTTELGELVATSTSARAGWLETVTVAFAGGHPDFAWIATIDSVTTVVAEGAVAADGTALVEFVIPPGTPPGEHLLTIRDAATGLEHYGQGVFVEPPAECLAGAAIDDLDGDGVRDLCDPTPLDGPEADADGDGIPNSADNCPLAANPGQEATPGRSVGLACDVRAGVNPVPTFLRLPFLDGPLCGFYVPTIVGGDGPDHLFGTAGPDVFFAGGGDDFVFGGDGTDVICGGGGDDRIWAGFGADLVDGGPGDDHIWGSKADDRLDGGPGFDRVDGGEGIDVCAGAERTWRCDQVPQPEEGATAPG